MSAELPVIADCYALTLDLTRRVEKFPRHHRATLGAELADRCRAVLAGLIRARYAAPTDRPSLLAAANVELELLRFGLRLQPTCGRCRCPATAPCPAGGATGRAGRRMVEGVAPGVTMKGSIENNLEREASLPKIQG